MIHEITTTIASPLAVIPPGIIAALAELRAEADACGSVRTLEEYEKADALAARIVAMDRACEKSRAEAKAPILELGRQIDEIAGEIRAPLLGAKARIGAMILAYQVAENRRREEERQRIEAENRRREAEAKSAQEAAEAERQAQIRETAEVDALMDWDALADNPPAEAVAEVPIFAPEILPPAAPALKSRAVVGKKVRDIIIDDASKIPDHLDIGGSKIPLWIVDETTVRRLALQLASHGATIPGVRVIEIDAIAAKGR